MAANYEMHKPYVLAELPRPLGSASTSYAIGDIYGQSGVGRRRRRPEIVVGIDGEAANLYDVSASRLITSYPIPPQNTFTCPPISIRVRLPKGKGIARYTYISTRDTSKALSITLFKDVVDGAGKTTSTSKTCRLRASSPVCYIGAAPSFATSTAPDGAQYMAGNLVVVCTNGDIFALDPEQLDQRWKESASKISRDEVSAPVSDYSVQSVFVASGQDIVDGIFEGHAASFTSALPQQVNFGEAGPDTIVLVSHMVRGGAAERQLSIFGILPAPEQPEAALQQMVQIHVAPIPFQQPPSDSLAPHYKLHLQSGSLLELQNGTLNVYDVTTTIATVKHTLRMQGATSFLRLSGHSTLAASPTNISIYNPAFHSLQATVPIHISSLAPGSADDNSNYTLSSYFRRLDLAVGLYDNLIIGVQVEPPKAGGKRAVGDGLLIDSIGKGTPKDLIQSRPTKRVKSSALTALLPGSVAGNYMERCLQDMDRADEFLAEGDLKSFEEHLAAKFQVELETKDPAAAEEQEEAPGGKTLPDWNWLLDPSDYPVVDRRWTLYTISRVIALDADAEDANEAVTLPLASSNVFIYLVLAGHLTISNIRAAFRDAQQGPEVPEAALAEGLVLRLAEVDPTLQLLVTYVHVTKLEPIELLMAIRTIMRSLDYIRDPFKTKTSNLLTEGPAEGETAEEDETIRMELDQLEWQLQTTEHHLDDNEATRARGLTSALAKLGTHSSQSVVRALRAHLRADEVFSLIFVLRGELVRGSWTSKYVDGTLPGTTVEPEAPSDDSICLIANLLSRCIDAVGPGGWLLNDTMTVDSGADFLHALKLEASAALEGIQEAVELSGVLGEVVRYGAAVRKHAKKGAKKDGRQLVIRAEEADVEAREGSWLPVGLKAGKPVSREKVVSGGEVVKRTQREIGHLVSHKVEDYSLESM
ncbi:uncharacterized protein DNG_05767 [Cephalotrichum gorgonifer]|uniref:Utp8 beta-propeller domain-containing protein n=1 Tax=Cephalotrichum gorgonifer TaxID=2041049 RepID=A0AAE8MYK7_9PEZI|nr:uncharacterized protein DNG_05767 [Cephalotrichum gorgonifer]